MSERQEISDGRRLLCWAEIGDECAPKLFRPIWLPKGMKPGRNYVRVKWLDEKVSHWKKRIRKESEDC